MPFLDLPDELLLLVMRALTITEAKTVKLNRRLRSLVNTYIWEHGKCVIKIGEQVSPDLQQYLMHAQHRQLRLDITAPELLSLWVHMGALVGLFNRNTSVLVNINYTASSFGGVKDCIENVNRMFGDVQRDIRLHSVETLIRSDSSLIRSEATCECFTK